MAIITQERRGTRRVPDVLERAKRLAESTEFNQDVQKKAVPELMESHQATREEVAHAAVRVFIRKKYSPVRARRENPGVYEEIQRAGYPYELWQMHGGESLVRKQLEFERMVKDVKEGAPNAEKNLLDATRGLAMAQVRRWHFLPVSQEDVSYAVNRGLLIAASKYDPRGKNAGVAFSAFASNIITKEVLNASDMKRYHTYVRNRDAWDTFHRLWERNGQRPSLDQVADEMGFEPKTVRNYLLDKQLQETEFEPARKHDGREKAGPDDMQDPDWDHIENALEKLTPGSLQHTVAKMNLLGRSYAQIAKATGKTVDQIDNAWTRVRRKLGIPSRDLAFRTDAERIKPHVPGAWWLSETEKRDFARLVLTKNLKRGWEYDKRKKLLKIALEHAQRAAPERKQNRPNKQ